MLVYISNYLICIRLKEEEERGKYVLSIYCKYYFYGMRMTTLAPVISSTSLHIIYNTFLAHKVKHFKPYFENAVYLCPDQYVQPQSWRWLLSWQLSTPSTWRVSHRRSFLEGLAFCSWMRSGETQNSNCVKSTVKFQHVVMTWGVIYWCFSLKPMQLSARRF